MLMMLKSYSKITKKQLGIKSGGPPTTFLLDGRQINKPAEIAEEQIKKIYK